MKDCINSYINYLDLNIEVHNDYIDQLMKEIDDLLLTINDILTDHIIIDIDGYNQLILNNQKISCFFYSHIHNVYPYDYGTLKKFIPENHIGDKIKMNISHINNYITDSIYYAIHIYLVYSMVICKSYDVPLTAKQITQTKQILFDNHYHSFPLINYSDIQIDI
jgi:hypothetical protein